MSANSHNNEVGIKGFDFVEFSAPNPQELHALFQNLGFSQLKKHEGKDIFYYQQNDIHFLLNDSPDSYASEFHKLHGPGVVSIGWRVENAEKAYKIAIKRGAKPALKSDYWKDSKLIPAIQGVGNSLIYFTDDYTNPGRLATWGFKDLMNPQRVQSQGFFLVDHLTNNVYPGQLEPLAAFYKDVFGFTEVRYFDIKGKKTGLLSYALRSPCGSFCIPINEGTESKSQINEYLEEYKGEGIQHIALLTSNMLATMETFSQNSAIQTLDIDNEYYDTVFNRVPRVSEDHEKIRNFNLLVDGDEEGYLLQIFTKNVIGPIFFEFIQRKNHFGFGEGNFGALFRAIEKDQERRGFL